MKTGTAAKRYAKALFGLTRDQGQLDTVRSDLVSLRGLLDESAEFRDFIESPLIPPEQRKDLLGQILGDTAHPKTHQFLLFLDEKGRLELLGGICDLFEALYDELNGIVKVDIISASGLNETQITAIEARLRARLDKQIQSTVALDPTVLGGFKVRIGDTILDYSIATQLKALRRRLLTA